MATWLQVLLGIISPLIIIFLIWGLPKIIEVIPDKKPSHKKVSKKEEAIQRAEPIKEIPYEEDFGDPGDVTL